jgi:Sec-independent protein translocase protein TatA
MVGHEGGRWDVGSKGNAVLIERISDSDKRLFGDSLAPEDARELAGLLTKYADKADESDDSDKADESEESDDSDNSDKPEESDKSEASDKSEESDNSDKSSN